MSLNDLKNKIIERVSNSQKIIYVGETNRFLCTICTERNEKRAKVSLTFATRSITGKDRKLSRPIEEITCDECGTIYRKGFSDEQKTAIKNIRRETYEEKLLRLDNE